MMKILREVNFNDELRLSLSHIGPDDFYFVSVDVVYCERFIVNLFKQDFNDKDNALACYNLRRELIEKLYTKS